VRVVAVKRNPLSILEVGHLMRLNGEIGQRNIRRIAIIGVVVAAMLTGVISPAQAEPLGPTVKTIVIEDRDAFGTTTLTLTFDGGISKAESEKVRASLAGSLATPNSIPVLGTPMWCGSYVSHGDSNGTLTIQYFCGPNATGSIPWGFQLSDGQGPLWCQANWDRRGCWLILAS
jgi:hypothetical protein